MLHEMAIKTHNPFWHFPFAYSNEPSTENPKKPIYHIEAHIGSATYVLIATNNSRGWSTDLCNTSFFVARTIFICLFARLFVVVIW